MSLPGTARPARILTLPVLSGKRDEEQAGGYTITPLGEGSHHFDANGKLTSITDRCSENGLEITYDSGKPVSVEDILTGRSITLTWNGSGKLTTLTDSMSQSWTLGYSQSGDDLVSLTQPGTSAPDTEFGYDANHRMTSHTDFAGFTYDIAYIASGDHANKLYTLTDPNDHVTATLCLCRQYGWLCEENHPDGCRKPGNRLLLWIYLRLFGKSL